MSNNLVPGQYQIGSAIIGHGTNVKVETFDPDAYEVVNQDSQASRTDEKNFGSDTLAAGDISITMSVMKNYILPNAMNIPAGVTNESLNAGWVSVGDLAREWRADEVRKSPGEIKPIYICGDDGVTRMVYGRPDKFKQEPVGALNRVLTQIICSFRRSDTVCYREKETAVELQIGDDPGYLTRLDGDANAWFRVLIYGPATHPKITIGTQTIDLDFELDDGDVVEISSYPWQRRAISSNREDLSPYLIGDTQYLDRMVIPSNTRIPVRWTSDEYNTWTPDLGNKDWNVDIDAVKWFTLPSFFHVLKGKVVARLDIFNPKPFSRFIGSPIFGHGSNIVIDTAHTFNGRDQFSSARIIEPIPGSSCIVIMSNTDMTNAIALEVVVGVLGVGNKLRIRNITALNTYSTIRAEWVNPAGLGWDEWDVVGIGSDYDATSGDTTYTAYFNGVAKATWVDTGNLVSTEATNRSQGYIFDMNGTDLTVGTGFHDMVSYDKAVVPTPTGRVLLLWRDAWGYIP